MNLLSILAGSFYLVLFVQCVQSQGTCTYFDLERAKKNPKDCGFGGYENIPTLTGVHCFLNHHGICKVLAGRFEFYIRTFEQGLFDVAGPSKYVDKFGYHERVPIAFTAEGQVLTADRPINWSRYFTASKPSYNLMKSTSFNWCKYARTNNWPYKSALKYKDLEVYFFNRQSCIYDASNGKLQHLNTRFQHKTKLRIDLDYNPIIFFVESPTHKGVLHVIKNKRQHYREMMTSIKKNPNPGPDQLPYFLQMDDLPDSQTLLKSGPFITKKFYNQTGKICISDRHIVREETHNYHIIDGMCGFEMVEIADLVPIPFPRDTSIKQTLIEVDLHNLPDQPPEVSEFYDIGGYPGDWNAVVSKGFVFSATTSVRLGMGNKMRVYSLFALFTGKPKNEFDEFYPMTYFSKYDVHSHSFDKLHNQVSRERKNNMKAVPNLNYVDDIAWLPACKTILVIFGPLYTEYPDDKFGYEESTRIGSIYDLGLNEMTNAFFGVESKAYFYHRVNFVAEHNIKCGTVGKSLSTGSKVGSYKFRHGSNILPFFQPFQYKTAKVNYQEELIFKDLGAFQGTLGPPDAPDAAKYPWDHDQMEGAKQSGLPVIVWVVIAVGVLLLIAMLILGCVTFRRRMRRRRFLEKTKRSSMAGSGTGGSAGSALPSRRSAMSSSHHSIPPTARSSRRSLRGSSRASGSSRVPGSSRASSSSRAPSSSATRRSGALSSGASRRSGLSKGRKPSSRPSSMASRSKPK